ncbi:MAG: hypothetical protein IJ080_05630 [Oscillospiraceae bacterium]|nr:hypothetical protein [Oscillospiraceae bacterium]
MSRQDDLRHIIEHNSISTQAQLIEKMRQCGHDVAQATLSRDLKRIGAVKDEYYYIPDRPALSEISLGSVLGVDHALNTVVIKCSAGSANAVCAELDMLDIPNVVGTIAGDDTIFVLMRTEKDADAFCVMFGRNS